MSAWWIYLPEDFLLFSERVYWRLFELHNAAVWPAQIVALLIGTWILALVLRQHPWSSRLIAVVLAVAWVFVAWTFFWTSYATINWAAPYVAPFFVAEALLLAWSGGVRNRLFFAVRAGPRHALGLGLFAYALLVHPFVAILAGRPLGAAEVVGVAPDPTAIATLGLLAMARAGRAVRVLLVLPLAWCLASGLTLYTIGTPEAWIPLSAVALSVLSRLRQA